MLDSQPSPHHTADHTSHVAPTPAQHHLRDRYEILLDAEVGRLLHELHAIEAPTQRTVAA